VVNSYGHVDDLVQAIEVMCVHPGAVGEIFNITAEGITSGQYVASLAQIADREAALVFVPDDVASSLATPAWGHLVTAVHHSLIATDKAEELLGVTPAIAFVEGHRATFEWFMASGMAEADSPLVDPLWRASWDFDWEAHVAARARGAS
jgi:nucleoside-diphosphate-sugar epimerase